MTATEVVWPLLQGGLGGVLGITAVLLPEGHFDSVGQPTNRRSTSGGPQALSHTLTLLLSLVGATRTSGRLGITTSTSSSSSTWGNAAQPPAQLEPEAGAANNPITWHWQTLADQLRVACTWSEHVVLSPLVAVQPVWVPPTPTASQETDCPHLKTAPARYAVVILEKGKSQLLLQVFGDIAHTLHTALLELQLDAIIVHCVNVWTGCASAGALEGRQVRYLLC